ncbi:VanZ family protein [Cryptosporangium sp. NPDC048952]|uniref:VanZ family protein n=1 Tax=Cryptosporangium sp. NPDC048952 TaxID=3363961 RepID=UPI003719D8E6
MVGAAWSGVVLVATLALLPAAAVVVALARWRSRRGAATPGLAQPGTGHAWRYSVAEVGMVVGTAPWLWMILTPRGSGRSVESVPLVGLIDQLGGAPAVAIEQIGGNLLVFAAFGACSALRWSLRVRTVTAIACAASITVEILQYALAIGRVTSVDDVLLNTLGATVAAFSVHLMLLLFKRRQARALV